MRSFGAHMHVGEKRLAHTAAVRHPGPGGCVAWGWVRGAVSAARQLLSAS